MTSETLAEYIQQGGNDELMPILWAKVQKLLYMKASEYYRLHSEQCSRSGVELWDIKQACYTVLINAVKAYSSESGHKLTTYLDYPFKTAVNELMGLRTSRTVNEPLNHCASLDKPIDNGEGDTVTLGDIVKDETSDSFIEDIDNRSEAETVRQIVDELEERYKSVIYARFFDDLSIKATAEKLSSTYSDIRQREAKALRILRGSAKLRGLYREQRKHEMWTQLSSREFSPEYFEALRIMREKANKY